MIPDDDDDDDDDDVYHIWSRHSPTLPISSTPEASLAKAQQEPAQALSQSSAEPLQHHGVKQPLTIQRTWFIGLYME